MNPETYAKLPDDVRDGLSVQIDRSLPLDIVEEVTEFGERHRIPVETFVSKVRKARKQERQNRRGGRGGRKR